MSQQLPPTSIEQESASQSQPYGRTQQNDGQMQQDGEQPQFGGQSQQFSGRTQRLDDQFQQMSGQLQQGDSRSQQGGDGLQGREFPTRTHLPEAVRRDSIRRLNRGLANTTVLLSQARYAHWNVKGQNFYQFHELFEEIAEELEDHADDIAERAASLGGQALGTTYLAASNSEIRPLPQSATGGLEFVSLLADRLAVHDANLSEDIEAATEAGDVDTADLLNEISRDVGEQIWFLEAHLQGQSTWSPTSGSPQGQQSTQGQGTQSQAMQNW